MFPNVLHCDGIPGILNSNLTIKSATSLDYFNDITIANTVRPGKQSPLSLTPHHMFEL